jgi:hypothetical protein
MQDEVSSNIWCLNMWGHAKFMYEAPNQTVPKFMYEAPNQTAPNWSLWAGPGKAQQRRPAL